MKPKKITESDWTPEHIRRLWDWYSTNPHIQASYFSFLVGNGIVNFLEATGKLRGRALDYGCGLGYLLSHFLKKNKLECYGVDFSEESVLKAKIRLGSHPNFREVVAIHNQSVPYPDNFFDVITLVETIEHLSNEKAIEVLGEIKRLVKPGGIILITTPFAENLEVDTIYCPFCNSEFHKWQHLKSYSRESLTSLVTHAGLKVQFCQNMDFLKFQEHVDFSLLSLSGEKLIGLLMSLERNCLDWIFPRQFPNGRDLSHKIKSGTGQHLCLLATKNKKG
jgi:SAM-dependent methyltransferase